MNRAIRIKKTRKEMSDLARKNGCMIVGVVKHGGNYYNRYTPDEFDKVTETAPFLFGKEYYFLEDPEVYYQKLRQILKKAKKEMGEAPTAKIRGKRWDAVRHAEVEISRYLRRIRKAGLKRKSTLKKKGDKNDGK